MSERRPIIAGNWKMHRLLGEAEALARGVVQGVGGSSQVEVVLAPPFTALTRVREAIKGSPVRLAAQDVYHQEQGAFTGEVSPGMLVDVGCAYVIIGHSERRALFGETDESVNLKVKAALGAGLNPILCIGERLEEREAGEAFNVVERQLLQALEGLQADEIGPVEPPHIPRLVLAYEPVWAIGTGRNATPEQAQEVHAFLRGKLTERFGGQTSARVRIQYGGSVKPDNIKALMAGEDIDGALVGGASLDADSFIRIVRF